VRDLLLQPPAENAYDTLKAQLIRRTGASEQKRLQQLLTAEELGDRTPTQLLRRMEQLLGDKATIIDASLLRELFLQRLPKNVRMVIASAGDIDLVRIAELADSIMEISTASPQVSTVHAQSIPEEVRELRAEVSRLADMVAQMQASRGRSASLRRPRRQGYKFGEKKKKDQLGHERNEGPEHRRNDGIHEPGS
ncbi:hypothetical protein HPB47_018655, partial [Ixodes persulcatus]